MKRRSRGEQMLAAAGLAPPSSVLKPVQKQTAEAADADVKSPPAKRARAAPKNGSPANSGQRLGAEQGSAPVPEAAIKLPSELELLLSMFDALRTGRMMLKRRSEKVTYNSVRHVVENMTKREFRVEHLAQMKYVRPESFDWQYIRAPSVANPQQLETQLLLTYDQPSSSGLEGGGAGSVGRSNSVAEVAEFRSRLERYVRETPMDPETGKLPPIPQAPLPPRPALPGATPARSGLASPAPSAGVSAGALSGPSDMQALGPLAALASPGGSSLSGASPSMTRSRSRLGIPTMGPPPAHGLTPIPEGTPTRHTPNSRQPRRQQPLNEAGAQGGGAVTLEEEEGAGEEQGREGEDAAAAEEPALELTQQGAGEATTQGAGCGVGAAATPPKGPRPLVQQTTPTSQQKQGYNDPRLARLHSLLSPAAMQKIMQTEAAQAAQTPEAKRKAEMRRAIQLMPHGHELVRLIFGLQGPTVKPLTQVSQAMCERSTQRQGLTARDASNTLVALARAVPEFLRIEEPRTMADGSARPRSVVISRVPNINAIAAKLKALAADPDAAVQSIFGGGGGAGATASQVAAPSPSTSVGTLSRMPPGSPTAQIKPRALASALEDGAGEGAAAIGDGPAITEMPPPPPSARKRPPGLPLPPPSPAMHRGPPPSPAMLRGGQTPTRSHALRSGGLFGSSGAAAGGLPLASHGTPTRSMPPVPAGGSELLQKLCKTGVSPAGKVVDSGFVVEASGPGAEAKMREATVVGAEGAAAVAVAVAGATPGRVAAGGRTPGRTATQEAMLNSIRKSSAKRSCRRLLEQEAGGESGEEDVAEEQPKPRRLEEFLGD